MTRIVHCPGCKVLLVEPTSGIAIYRCGNCLKVLYAKHAIQAASLNLPQEPQRPVQQNQLSNATSPSPPPLYTQRPAQVAALSPAQAAYSSPSPNGKPLYTPRPRHAADHKQQQPSSLLLQDMARDAFPTGSVMMAPQQEANEFEFQKQVAGYKQHADDDGCSDYHSTLEELERSSRRSGVSDCYPSSARVDGVSSPGGLIYEERHRHGRNGFSRSTSSDSEFSPLPRDRQLHNSESSSFKEEQEANEEHRQVSVSGKTYPPLQSPYVWCQHCKTLLEVPCNLPPRNSTIQKLRCGACQRVSRFAVLNSNSNSNSSRSNFNFTPPKDPAQARDAMLHLDIMTSNSPGRGSAPGSFHHAPQQAPTCFASGDNKGYDSAPEFQTSYSVASHEDQRSSVSVHHTRSESGTSSTDGRSLPMAPCLHELFGYDSPSQFVHKQQEQLPNEKQLKADRGGGLRGLLLKSIHDIGKLHVTTERRIHVTVNGNAIPDEVVRRAEKQAGHIYPGSYWYDYRAGFWGVMGGPCLGIIPPYIQEFNYPMQINCAGGNTGVVVNGRELHEQDMALLVKRGLPPASNAAYTVDIDGTVVDLSSEIQQAICLGRLAPTVEKQGVGFGMHPRVAS